MSLKTNTASLQEILDMINNLPEGKSLSNVKRAAGVCTPFLTESGYSVASINCGFKPDLVFLSEGWIDEMEGYGKAAMTGCLAFTESNTAIIETMFQEDNDAGLIYIQALQTDTGCDMIVRLIDWSWEINYCFENLNYIAVKYQDVGEKSDGVILPTLANQGTSADLMVGKQLIDANGNVVFGTYLPKTSLVETTTTKLSAASTTITFTGLSAEPKMFSIVPTGNITLGTTRYVTGVTYDGTITHGVYGYRQSSSATSYYSSDYFTWTYSNGTLTVKTSSSTNGCNFTNSVTYQLNYVVEDEISVGGGSSTPQVYTGFVTGKGQSGHQLINCGFVPDYLYIYTDEGYTEGGVSFNNTMCAPLVELEIGQTWAGKTFIGESFDGTGKWVGAYVVKQDNGFAIGSFYELDIANNFNYTTKTYRYKAVKYT